MNLNKYITGERKGEAINRLEKEAMRDPFFADVLEGYDRVKGNHESRIEAMRRNIFQKTKKHTINLRNWSIAASILVVLGLGGWYFIATKDVSSEKKLASKPFDNFDQVLIDSILIAMNENKTDTAPSIAQDLTSKSATVKQKETDNLPLEKIKSEPLKRTVLRDSDLEYSNESEGVAIADMTEIRVVEESAGNKPVLSLMPVQEQDTAVTDTMPVASPVSGQQNFEDYIAKNRKEASGECAEVHGKVRLQFSVDKNGRPNNIKVIKPLCASLDREAVRLLRNSPAWRPEMKNIVTEIEF